MTDRFEQEIRHLNEVSNNPEQVVISLEALAQVPVEDKRILPYLERLCTDTRITRIGIPASYAEVRYMAAYTLRAHYEILGIDKVVYLPQIHKPLTQRQLAIMFEDEIGERWHDKGLNAIQAYKMLVEMGKAPTYDLRLAPRTK